MTVRSLNCIPKLIKCTKNCIIYVHVYFAWGSFWHQFLIIVLCLFASFHWRILHFAHMSLSYPPGVERVGRNYLSWRVLKSKRKFSRLVSYRIYTGALEALFRRSCMLYYQYIVQVCGHSTIRCRRFQWPPIEWYGPSRPHITRDMETGVPKLGGPHFTRTPDHFFLRFNDKYRCFHDGDGCLTLAW